MVKPNLKLAGLPIFSGSMIRTNIEAGEDDCLTQSSGPENAGVTEDRARIGGVSRACRYIGGCLGCVWRSCCTLMER